MTLVGSVVRVDIERVAHGGHCVGRHEGRVVFVRHALPGERVEVRITDGDASSRFLRGDAIEIVEASPDRVDPPCRFSGPGACGGCDFQHASLPAQRALKAAVVREQLSRLAGIDVSVDVEALPGDPRGLHWRSRVDFAVDADGRAGLRRHRSHDVVLIDDCLIADPEIVATGILTRSWSDVASVSVTAPTAGAMTPEGEIGSGQAVVVTTDQRKSDRLSSGPERIVRQAAGRTWTTWANGFWQVHPQAADVLARAVEEDLAPRPGESALDLYAGAGLFAGVLGERVGSSGSVIAVESSATAAHDARENLADMPHVRVEHRRVDQWLAHDERIKAPHGTSVDLVVLDPPRKGAGAGVVRSVVARRPRAVAYVACDPAALARDLHTFRELGYHLSRLRAFDLFPMTHHVECLAIVEPDDGPTREDR